jgi:hypothetical protein
MNEKRIFWLGKRYGTRRKSSTAKIVLPPAAIAD